MNYNLEISVYLEKISTAVLVLSNVTSCDLPPIGMKKVIVTMLDQEQQAADFISEMGISGKAAKPCRMAFIHANKAAISNLKKFQYQSERDFDELTTALKLETESLEKELS